MKMFVRVPGRQRFPVSKIAFALLFVGLFYSSGLGQAREQNAVSASAPTDEQFEKRSELLIPWKDTHCLPRPERVSHLGCNMMTEAEIFSSHRLSLFNENGSLWYTFSVNRDQPDYFDGNKKVDFVPFATDESKPFDPNRKGRPMSPEARRSEPSSVLLRVTGESLNWYSVEVNENTRLIKYAPKTERMWAKVPWDFLFLENSAAYIDNDTTKLLDRVGGKPLPDVPPFNFGQILIHKIEGDWMYVEGFRNPDSYFGWIRWRSGRNILIGCVYNDYSVPSPKN